MPRILTQEQLAADQRWLASDIDKAELGDEAVQRWPAAISTAMDALTKIQDLYLAIDMVSLNERNIGAELCAKALLNIAQHGRRTTGVFGTPAIEQASNAIMALRERIRSLEEQLCEKS